MINKKTINLKKNLIIIFLLFTLFLTNTCFAADNIITLISIKSPNITISVGKYYQLSTTLLPLNAKRINLIWSSSNKNIVKVNSFGTIYAVKPGKVTITAKTPTGKKESCSITVSLIENEKVKAYNGKTVTKAQLANFRNVYTGKIGKNILYRCINPIAGGSAYATAANYADKMLQEHQVQAILNVENNSSSIPGNSYKNSTYYKKLFKDGKVYAKYLDWRNPASKSFQKEVVNGLKFFTKHNGPYAIHCHVGRDRTGFIIMLIECLMNSPYDYIYNDFTMSFKNLNLIGRSNTQKENYNSNFSAYMKIITKKSASNPKKPKASDWKNINFVKCAENYLKQGGMSSSEITKLKNNLSKNK